MGYYTRVTGEIRIEPPLTWQEFKDSRFLPGSPNDNGNYDVRLCVDEETVDTDEGQLVRKTASVVLPRWDDSFKAYNLVEHVQAVIDAFPGHTFSGRLECEGEDNTDMWRVVVRNGHAVKVEPRIVWPDEDEADLERARSIAVALEQENAHQTERLAAIHKLADGLEDYLPGDTWHLAHTIKQLAEDTITVAEALAEDGGE